jgi:hypothetical protein
MPGEGVSRGRQSRPDRHRSTVSKSVGPVEKEQFGGLGFGLILFGGLGL